METRLAKRQRNAQQARERNAQLVLERNIARFVGLGVPPGVVRKVLPMARLLRRELPLPDDMVDQVALHYLWDIRRRIRYLWSWLDPLVTETDAFHKHYRDGGRAQKAVKRLLVRGRWIIDEDGEYAAVTPWWNRYISRARFTVEARPDIVVYTEPWTFQDDRWEEAWTLRESDVNPFFPFQSIKSGVISIF